MLYERTGLSTDKKKVIEAARATAAAHPVGPKHLVRDPYVLEFLGLPENSTWLESDLEQAMLDHLQAFLLELGAGFCFEARQYRIDAGAEDDRVDLVFYHRRLKCHVLFELKNRRFRPADAGQMNYYLNIFKDRLMTEGDMPPVGIIFCCDKEQTKVEFATAGIDNQVFVSRYLVALPSAEQLRTFVEQDRARLQALADEKHDDTNGTGDE